MFLPNILWYIYYYYFDNKIIISKNRKKGQHLSVNKWTCIGKRRLKKFFYTMFFSGRAVWVSIESVLTTGALWELVAICSDTAANEIYPVPAGLHHRGLEQHSAHSFWQLLCPVQITDGQQDQTSSWKHLPVSVETGWTVSTSQLVCIFIIHRSWHQMTLNN